MARVLVVEHEKDMRDTLELGLRSGGHLVHAAADTCDALRLAEARPPDFVVLDLSLPERAAIVLVQSLRADARSAHASIIAMADRGESADAILTTAYAPDHCLPTPFAMGHLLELISTLHAAARRPGDGIISVGDLHIDRDIRRVELAGRDITLTAIEFNLLVTLYDRRGRIQTRAVLLSDVWGIHGDVRSRTVDTHVKRLRHKLDAARDYIETVRGVGYRFVVPISDQV